MKKWSYEGHGSDLGCGFSGARVWKKKEMKKMKFWG